jgi:hypothetical protein
VRPRPGQAPESPSAVLLVNLPRPVAAHRAELGQIWTISKSSLRAPHSGQVQFMETSAQAVPGWDAMLRDRHRPRCRSSRRSGTSRYAVRSRSDCHLTTMDADCSHATFPGNRGIVRTYSTFLTLTARGSAATPGTGLQQAPRQLRAKRQGLLHDPRTHTGHEPGRPGATSHRRRPA